MFEDVILFIIYLVLYQNFIYLILSMNFVLIFVLLRKPKFYENVKWMVTLSLAVGDLVLALFSLVVEVIHLLGNYYYLTCGLVLISRMHMYFLIHFIYGVGLFILGVDILLRIFFRSFFQAMRYKPVLAIGLSGLPWIMGLIILLPLCLSGLDRSHNCSSCQSPISMITVSALAPASLVLILTITINCLQFPVDQLTVSSSQENLLRPSADEPMTSADDAPDPVIVGADEVNCIDDSSPDVQNMSRTVQDDDVQQGGGVRQPENVEYFQNTNVHNDALSSTPQHDQCPDGESDLWLDHHRTVQRNVTSHQPPFIQQQNVSRSPHLHGNNNNNNNTVPASGSPFLKERRMLLIISILYFVMVIPNATFVVIANTIHLNDDIRTYVGSQIVYWLMLARSIVAPIVMFIHCVTL